MGETSEEFLKRVASDTKRRGGVMFEGKEASAHLLALARRGAKVPDESTEEMVKAARNADPLSCDVDDDDIYIYTRIWSAMLQTALKDTING